MNYISYIIVGNSFFLLSKPDEISYTSTNWSDLLNMLGQFFFLTVTFIAILFIAVFSLKFAARFRNFSGGGSNLRVIESKSLGSQNFVHLVKAANKYVLIGTSKGNIAFLTEVDGADVTDIFKDKSPMFQEHLTQQVKKLFNKDMPPED